MSVDHDPCRVHWHELKVDDGSHILGFSDVLSTLCYLRGQSTAALRISGAACLTTEARPLNGNLFRCCTKYLSVSHCPVILSSLIVRCSLSGALPEPCWTGLVLTLSFNGTVLLCHNKASANTCFNVNVVIAAHSE